MDDSDEDAAQLRQAIALSLQDQDQGVNSKAHIRQTHCTSGPEVINLDSDDDIPSPKPLSSTKANTANEEGTSTVRSFLGLNRKAMEEERLARRQKTEISPLPAQHTGKSSDSAFSHASDSNKNIALKESVPLEKLRFQKPSTSAKSHMTIGPTFPDGVVKKTWAFCKAREADIRFEEVLQSHDLKLAVLSAFLWDVPWVLSKLKSGTNMVFVMQAKDDSTREQYERETSAMANLKLCFPPMPGQVKCMHSKLMLLSYSTHLRIVVPTANLTPYDWGEVGVMENMLFLIDLPRLPGDTKCSRESLTPFGRELVYFIEAMGLPQKIVDSIYKFDFSRTKEFAFVHSIGGVHVGEDEPWRRTGYCGLGNAIKELGLETSDPISIDFVTSSLGNATMRFLSSIYLAAQGDSGMTEFGWGRGKATAETLAQNKIYSHIRENFHIYFPTLETVVSSNGGTACAGTVCFQPHWYNSPTFPKQLLRDCKSRREGMLMHNKVGQIHP